MNEKNIKVVNPDVRFGTSYLSLEYEDAAVKDEVMMDKIDGEIFIKRPLDGRVISFSQNNKFLHETLMELKILLKNYTNMKYPIDDSSFFSSTDYMTRYIRGGQRLEVLMGDDLEFSASSLDEARRFDFYVSKRSNGFFCMVKPRLSDKAFIEYLTNQYNLLCKNYTGSDQSILSEKFKFTQSGYETSNATISYTMTVRGYQSDGTENMIQLDSTTHIKMAEESMIPFPDSYSSQFDEILDIKVNINRISFDKIHFMDDYISSHPDFDRTIYDRIIAPDNRIDIPIVNIFSFIDNSSQIPTASSRQIIVLIDSPSLHNYIGILDKLSVGSGIIASPSRPLDSLWTINNAWAETIRHVQYGGSSYDADCETDVDLLEDLIYKMDGIVTGFSLDENEKNMMFVQRLSSKLGV